MRQFEEILDDINKGKDISYFNEAEGIRNDLSVSEVKDLLMDVDDIEHIALNPMLINVLSGSEIIKEESVSLATYLKEKYMRNYQFFFGLFRDRDNDEIKTLSSGEEVTIAHKVKNFNDEMMDIFSKTGKSSQFQAPFNDVSLVGRESLNDFEYFLPVIIAKQAVGDLKGYLADNLKIIEGMTPEKIKDFIKLEEKDGDRNLRFLLLNACISYYDDTDKTIFNSLVEILNKFNVEQETTEAEA